MMYTHMLPIRWFCTGCNKCIAAPARIRKAKSIRIAQNPVKQFVDTRMVTTFGGRGGNGCVSFLHLWANELAGPDGGDGGHGGHVLLRSSHAVRDLSHLSTELRATDGVRGRPDRCAGRCAAHTHVLVPVGTVVRSGAHERGAIVADLAHDAMTFVAARGGTGGRGNKWFATAHEQKPQVAEEGACGEERRYCLEVRSMAHIGLVGPPNAGKSSLLRAISRARPHVAPYPFTTVAPHIGVVPYADREQVAVADLPGLIDGAHRNRGLGSRFLRHIERCVTLVLVVDVASKQPSSWLDQVQMVLRELTLYSGESNDLSRKVNLIVANKVDLSAPGEKIDRHITYKSQIVPVLPLSAKYGTNLSALLEHIRRLYDEHKLEEN